MPSTMPNLAAITSSCPHDRGRGTTICLRCRADDHAVTATRRRRLLAQVAAVAVTVAALVSMGQAALSHLLRANSQPTQPSRTFVQAGTPTSSRSATASTPIASAPKVAAPTPQVALAAAILPAVAFGRTELQDGMFVTRTSDSVTVHFDMPATRTRRRDKFERTVRATLPAIYGARADSSLRQIPDGRLLPEGDLLVELPLRGVRLPSRDGFAIMLWPETRPGQDGPLVVSYRAVISRAR